MVGEIRRPGTHASEKTRDSTFRVSEKVGQTRPLEYNTLTSDCGGSVGIAKTPPDVKLIVSLLGADVALLDQAQAALEEVFGPADWQSELLPFDHTNYYTAEHGPGLMRRLVAFQRLIDPGRLSAIKHQTNALEGRWTREGRRRVNLDPGYLSLSKLVLATTKDHGHRVYLGGGIYAEVTLRYQDGSFQTWPWTYPDYGSPRYCALLGELRERYKAQLRETRPPVEEGT